MIVIKINLKINEAYQDQAYAKCRVCRLSTSSTEIHCLHISLLELKGAS